MGPLHIILVYSNPRRFKSRNRLATECLAFMSRHDVQVIFVEHAFGERPHEFDTEAMPKNVRHIKVRGGADHELWIKEALANIGVRHLPQDWRYMAWIDADVSFVRPDWAEETVHMLQHHQVGQLFSHSIDLGPNGEVMRNEWGSDADRSFCAAWLAGDIDVPSEGYGPGRRVRVSRALLANRKKTDYRQHYGYAWAIRREAFDGIGGFPDWLVTGSADYHMALCFAGKFDRSEAYVSEGCRRRLMQFAERCDRHIRQDIGCVSGTLIHGFHGAKALRRYLTRKEILEESGFDPDLHLTHDWQGIPSLAGDNRLLRDGLRRLMVMRNEDDIRMD